MRLKLITTVTLIVIVSGLCAADDPFTRCNCSGFCHGLPVNSSAIVRGSDMGVCQSRSLRLWGKYCGGISNCTTNCVDMPARIKCGLTTKGKKIFAGDPCEVLTAPTPEGGPPIFVGYNCGTNCECNESTIICESENMPTPSQCCTDWCSGLSGEALNSCIYTCENTCRTNELMNFAVYILIAISAFIVAVMLAYHGARIMLSDDLAARESSKKSIQYAVIALVILILVFFIVKLLFYTVHVHSGPNVPPDCV